MRPDGTTLLAKRFDTRKQHARGGHRSGLRPRTSSPGPGSTPRPGRGRTVTGSCTTAASEGSPRRRSPRRASSRFELPYADPTPRELSTRLLKPEELGYADLRAHIARLRASGTDPGDLPVQLALKLSFPFVVLIMTLLGAPIAAGAQAGRLRSRVHRRARDLLRVLRRPPGRERARPPGDAPARRSPPGSRTSSSPASASGSSPRPRNDAARARLSPRS